PNEALFAWKHLENPFGPSAMWVAEADGRLAGYRAFMRWELTGAGDRTRRAVRAVDTATHPDFQRRGVFSSLTSAAVEEMTSEGVDLVFNTPNEQSLPGYLKLGWESLGHLPIAARPTSFRALSRLRGARAPAAKWSERTDVGDPGDALEPTDLEPLLEARTTVGLSTRLSPAFVRWRFGLGELGYRVWAPDGPDAGAVYFRIRRRGTARECAVSLVLTPPGEPDRGRALLAGLRRAVDADYLLTLGTRWPGSRFVSVPGHGPVITVRSLAAAAPTSTDDWDLQLGDIELF
ncbi:MAG: GNAT family N-acetyltransferase, partial [Actinomycetota bacterium]